MPRDPTFTDLDAEAIRSHPDWAAIADGYLSWEATPSGSTWDYQAYREDSYAYGSDPEYVYVYLDQTSIYDFVLNYPGTTPAATPAATPSLALLDDQGYLLQYTDGETVAGYVEEPYQDTVVDYQPDYTGWHVLWVPATASAPGVTYTLEAYQDQYPYYEATGDAYGGAGGGTGDYYGPVEPTDPTAGNPGYAGYAYLSADDDWFA